MRIAIFFEVVARIWRRSVVLPLPRGPVTRVIAVRTLTFYPFTLPIGMKRTIRLLIPALWVASMTSSMLL